MKRIKLKNKSKKKLNFKFIKFLLFILIIIISMILTIKYLVNNNTDITKEAYLDYLLNKTSNKSTNNFIVKESLKLLSNIDLSKPESLLSFKSNIKEEKEKIKKDAKASEDNYDQSTYEKLTSFVENKNENIEEPLIYIYNSHQLETYQNMESGISPNVLMVSYLLSDRLNKEGVKTISENTNIYEFIKTSNLPENSFYASTRIFIKNMMNKYNTLKYFIDIHRDAVSKEISTANISGKNYARILFVLGTTNPNYKENENLMQSLDEISDKYYPNLSRGIFKRDTPDWPDSYNQDLNNGVILIEVGSSENTIEEVSNTIDALTKIIKIYVKGE